MGRFTVLAVTCLTLMHLIEADAGRVTPRSGAATASTGSVPSMDTVAAAIRSAQDRCRASSAARAPPPPPRPHPSTPSTPYTGWGVAMRPRPTRRVPFCVEQRCAADGKWRRGGGRWGWHQLAAPCSCQPCHSRARRGRGIRAARALPSVVPPRQGNAGQWRDIEGLQVVLMTVRPCTPSPPPASIVPCPALHQPLLSACVRASVAEGGSLAEALVLSRLPGVLSVSNAACVCPLQCPCVPPPPTSGELQELSDNVPCAVCVVCCGGQAEAVELVQLAGSA